jgi:DNA uptake protein ComE-like DNA-binding protein
MEKTMSENTSTLLAKLADLEAKADAYTTQQGKRLAEAVAAARKAQQAEDQESAKAEMAAALAKIDEIGKGLVTFSPSGN